MLHPWLAKLLLASDYCDMLPLTAVIVRVKFSPGDVNIKSPLKELVRSLLKPWDICFGTVDIAYIRRTEIC
jgi:hypothetical protein